VTERLQRKSRPAAGKTVARDRRQEKLLQMLACWRRNGPFRLGQMTAIDNGVTTIACEPVSGLVSTIT
jgi:hypothetical protein